MGGENSRVGVRENIVRMRATARQEWWSRKENCKGVRITQWQHGNSRAAEAVGHLLRCVQSIQGEVNWLGGARVAEFAHRSLSLPSIAAVNTGYITFGHKHVT